MKKLITLFAASMMLLSVGAQANSCPDDPRLDNVRSLIKAVKKGENIEPLQMQYGTYLEMNDKIKAFIGGGDGNPNFKIVDGNCDQPIMIDGEMITKFEMPLEEIMKYISTMQDKGDVDGIDNLIKNVKAKDVSIKELFKWLSIPSFPLISEATVCQLSDAGVLKYGKPHPGKLTGMANCRAAGDWDWPSKIDLYAGFGGQILGKNKQVYFGYIDGGMWTNGMYVQFVTTQSGSIKSDYWIKEYNRDKGWHYHNLVSLNVNLARMNTGSNLEVHQGEHHKVVYQDYLDKMIARHNATMAGSDELGEDDGSEKE